MGLAVKKVEKISRYDNVSYYVILGLLLAVKWPEFEQYI